MFAQQQISIARDRRHRRAELTGQAHDGFVLLGATLGERKVMARPSISPSRPRSVAKSASIVPVSEGRLKWALLGMLAGAIVRGREQIAHRLCPLGIGIRAVDRHTYHVAHRQAQLCRARASAIVI